MNRTCGACGEVNEAGTAYCVNPACGAALAVSAEPPPLPTAVVAEEPRPVVTALRSPGRLVLPVVTVVALVAAAITVWALSGRNPPAPPAAPVQAALPPAPQWTSEPPPPSPTAESPSPATVTTANPPPTPKPKPTQTQTQAQTQPPPPAPPAPAPPAVTVDASGACESTGYQRGWGVFISATVRNAAASVSSASVSYSASGVDPNYGPSSGSVSLTVRPAAASGNIPSQSGWEFVGGSGVSWTVTVRLANGQSYSDSGYTSSCY